MEELKSKELISAMFAFTVFTLVGLWCTDKLEGVGNYLSGVGTIGLLFVAIWQIPKELEKNRNQRHKDRVTDIAYELSENTVRFVDALKSLINPFSWSNEVLPEDIALQGTNNEALTLVKIFRYRNSQNEKENKSFFNDSWKIIFVTNHSEVKEHMDKLKDIYFSLATNINMLNSYLNEDRSLSREYIEKFRNVVTVKDLDRLKDEILTLLSADFQ